VYFAKPLLIQKSRPDTLTPYGASLFLTNDPNLKKVADITVFILDDFADKT